MSELSLQRDVIESVEARGGFAKKLSNRFLIGVADLYVKLPRHPGVFIEVKDEKLPKKSDHVLLGLTPLQRRFLMDAHRAGDNAAVLSFIAAPNKLWAHMLPIDRFPADNRLPVKAHHQIVDRRKSLAEFIYTYLGLYGRKA